MSISHGRASSRAALLAVAITIFAFALPAGFASADTTATLFPNGQGTYTQWNGDEGDVDETGTPSCQDSPGDVIDSDTSNNRESVIISLSTVPNGATITSVDISVWWSDDASNGNNGTFKTFARLNGANVDAGTDLVAATSNDTCAHNTTQIIDVADTVKIASSTLEIGVIKTATDTDDVRVGAVRAVVTYTPAAPGDTTPPPPPTINSGPAEGATITSSSTSIAFSDTEGGVTFECKVDAGAFAVCTSPQNLTNLTNGPHTFTVKAKDAANNYSSEVARNFTVSLAAPPNPPPPSPTISQGKVTITVDDGWKNTWTSIMSAGIFGPYKTTQYVYSDAINQVHGPSFATAAEIKSMFDAGHDIGAHSRTHSNLTATTSAGVTSEVQGSKTDIANALVVAESVIKSFAYPFGAHNATVRQAVVDAGFAGARTVEPGFNTSASDPITLQIQHVGDTTTVAELKGWISQATSTNSWLILMFHEIVPTVPGDCQADDKTECTTRTTVAAMVDFLEDNQVCVQTMAQVLTNTACPAAVPTFTLTASAGANGSISPAGSTVVNQGANQTFNIVPEGGYHVLDVLVDGVSVGAVTTYTFNNVTAAHTIAATFAADAPVTFTITAETAGSGDISPSGAVVVAQGANQTFTLTPSSGFSVSEILVDGTPTTTADSYAFLNVTANHTITVSFTGPSAPSQPEERRSRGGGGRRTGVSTSFGGVVLGTTTAPGLSSSQIQSILGLLISFGADQKTMDKVKAALEGKLVLGTSTGGSGYTFTRTLMQGMSGADVTGLQNRLTKEGHYTGPITGYFGPMTKAAVIKYQAAKGLPQVGIVGPLTLKSLNGK